jgi:hypothetical protein
MKVEYVQGRDVCERCGAYIKNIFIITFDDGYSIRVGSECVKKVLKETNLTDKGCTYVERLMKPVEKYRKLLATWQRISYEQALAKKMLVMRWDDEAGKHRNQTEEEFEESKARMVNIFLPRRIREEEEEMNRVLASKTKNVHIRH